MGLRRELKRLFRKREPQGPPPLPSPDELRRLGYCVPNFFIAGAARCGTTSLWAYLNQHPEVFMPPTFEFKEPSYFCDLYGMKDWREYFELFSPGAGRTRIGEASGAYLTAPESPARLRAALPESHFIISLRNPAERAYSLYKWMHANGYETHPTFEAALEAEKTRFASKDFMRNNGQNYYNFLYFHSGLYAPQVQRFWDAFGRKRVHVVIFEDFVKAPLKELRAIFEFLGIATEFTPKLEVHNASAPSYGEYAEATRARLVERYRPAVAELEGLLQRDLQKRWS